NVCVLSRRRLAPAAADARAARPARHGTRAAARRQRWPLSRGRGCAARSVRRGRDQPRPLRSGLGRARRRRPRIGRRIVYRHARDTLADLYDRLAKQSGLAKRRTAGELPVQGGPLVLDAAFLVPTTRTRRFQSLAAREARALARRGYRLTLSGPWPPYNFIQ